MDKMKQPGIKFENLILKNLDFRRELVIPPKSELILKFDASVSMAPDGKKMACELNCKIGDKEKSFEITCSMIGFFSAEEGHENMSLQEFGEGNAPALVFPFLREIIASTTVKAGMPPLILPPMNVKAMLKHTDEVSKKELP